MRTTTRCWTWAVIAVAVGGGILPAVPADTQQTCPFGQHEDTQTPGFQCVLGWCPPGTLLDGVSGACVAAPGVPPPPLS
jgi:hypothetical protein